MDDAWEFEKQCRETGKELFEEALGFIQRGDGDSLDDKLGDLTYEFTDRMVPIYTGDLWKLTAYLEEFWDDVDRSGTLDQAFRQAVFYKASEYVVEEFEKHGSDDKLQALKDAYEAAATAMVSDDPQRDWKQAGENYADEFKTLEWPTAWPPIQPSLQKLYREAQMEQEKPAPEPPRIALVSSLSLSHISRPAKSRAPG